MKKNQLMKLTAICCNFPKSSSQSNVSLETMDHLQSYLQTCRDHIRLTLRLRLTESLSTLYLMSLTLLYLFIKRLFFCGCPFGGFGIFGFKYGLFFFFFCIVFGKSRSWTGLWEIRDDGIIWQNNIELLNTFAKVHKLQEALDDCWFTLRFLSLSLVWHRKRSCSVWRISIRTRLSHLQVKVQGRGQRTRQRENRHRERNGPANWTSCSP